MIAVATLGAYLTDMAVIFGAVALGWIGLLAERRHQDRKLDVARGRRQGFKVKHGPRTWEEE